LTRCRYCGILFFTHPRNAGRNDLRCPVGCRQAHRRQSSIKRSVEYYQSKEGKGKKRDLNARRKKALPASDCIEEQVLQAVEEQIDPTLILHIQLTTSLIEGRTVGLPGILVMLGNILRQHSIGFPKKLLYLDLGHQSKPP